MAGTQRLRWTATSALQLPLQLRVVTKNSKVVTNPKRSGSCNDRRPHHLLTYWTFIATEVHRRALTSASTCAWVHRTTQRQHAPEQLRNKVQSLSTILSMSRRCNHFVHVAPDLHKCDAVYILLRYGSLTYIEHLCTITCVYLFICANLYWLVHQSGAVTVC